MPPREKIVSTIGFQYPQHRDNAGKNVYQWLEDKRAQDFAEGYWRVHDDLYDMTDFVKVHPGGSFWLEQTKGTDVTEAFEAHHITEKAERILQKFHVREAANKRHPPYTFEEGGFYRTLKKEVREVLKDKPKGRDWKSDAIADGLVVMSFVAATMACEFWSYTLGMLAGLLLCWATVASHNYFHRADNFRMYYFDLASLSSREWRISHALSHHLLTNTVYDLELSMFEPFFDYLPMKKGVLKKIVSLAIPPLIWTFLFHASALQRIILATTNNGAYLHKTHLIPLLLPTVMLLCGNQHFLATLAMWNFVILVTSFCFGFIGLNAAHHHPDIFHDGDKARKNKDWGISQLDAVMDRKEITGSHFLVLTHFGDHALHHMFPTLDHGSLNGLYPAFKKVCKKFNIDLRVTSQLELIKGQFQQLVRTEPNAEVPDLLKYSKDK